VREEVERASAEIETRILGPEELEKLGDYEEERSKLDGQGDIENLVIDAIKNVNKK
jgi:hypothetical protein